MLRWKCNLSYGNYMCVCFFVFCFCFYTSTSCLAKPIYHCFFKLDKNLEAQNIWDNLFMWNADKVKLTSFHSIFKAGTSTVVCMISSVLGAVPLSCEDWISLLSQQWRTNVIIDLFTASIIWESPFPSLDTLHAVIVLY